MSACVILYFRQRLGHAYIHLIRQQWFWNHISANVLARGLIEAHDFGATVERVASSFYDLSYVSGNATIDESGRFLHCTVFHCQQPVKQKVEQSADVSHSF